MVVECDNTLKSDTLFSYFLLVIMGQSSTSLQELSFQERIAYLVVGYTKEELTEVDLIQKFDTSINSVMTFRIQLDKFSVNDRETVDR